MQNSTSTSDAKGGNRKSAGKRKLVEDRDPPRAYGNQTRTQATITDLFSVGPNHSSDKSPKRMKRDSSPRSDVTSDALEPIAVEKMYNFSTGSPGNEVSKAAHQNLDTGSPSIIGSRAYNTSRPSNFTPHTGAKKLVVKNLKAIPRFDQGQYFEKVWSQLDAALTAIFDNQKPAHSLEELYRGAENVCRQGKAPILAKRLRDRCEGYISGKLLGHILSKVEAGSDVDVLWAVEDAWSGWNSRLVSFFFFFFNLPTITASSGRPK